MVSLAGLRGSFRISQAKMAGSSVYLLPLNTLMRDSTYDGMGPTCHLLGMLCRSSRGEVWRESDRPSTKSGEHELLCRCSKRYILMQQRLTQQIFCAVVSVLIQAALEPCQHYFGLSNHFQQPNAPC